jgi:hypothetical protein
MVLVNFSGFCFQIERWGKNTNYIEGENAVSSGKVNAGKKSEPYPKREQDHKVLKPHAPGHI